VATGGGGGGASPNAPGAGGQSDTTGPGSPGAGPLGGDGFVGAQNAGAGGGGGGGYYGGGGGGETDNCGAFGFGGGAGSTYADPAGTNVSYGNDLTATPMVTISYLTDPSFTSAPINDTVQTGSAYSRSITVSATPTATLSIASGALPAGLTFVDNGDNTATVSGTPTAPGSYGFDVLADNSNGPPDTQTEHINVFVPAPISPSPSPSVSATTSPSATPTATVSPRQALTLVVNTPSIAAGSTARLTATGAANEAYQLQCYTRPSTTYFTARSGSFDATGSAVTFTLSLGRNTRCFIQYATTSTQGASPSVVVNVHTVLSLSTVRTGVRSYIFQGRNLPRVAGQLITLYRVDGSGNEIRTSNLVTDSSGIYRVTRTFTGTGTFQFKVRTSQTLNNAAGVSNTITVNVH
jgi:hypothetical protein